MFLFLLPTRARTRSLLYLVVYTAVSVLGLLCADLQLFFSHRQTEHIVQLSSRWFNARVIIHNNTNLIKTLCSSSCCPQGPEYLLFLQVPWCDLLYKRVCSVLCRTTDGQWRQSYWEEEFWVARCRSSLLVFELNEICWVQSSDKHWQCARWVNVFNRDTREQDNITVNTTLVHSQKEEDFFH